MIDLDFTQVLETIRQAKDLGITSLPQYTKPALIESPMFIQDSIIDEPIRDHIIKNLYSLYCGYLLVAMKMNETVDGTRTVRDILGTIATNTDVTGQPAQEFLDADALIAGFGKTVKSNEGSDTRYIDATKTGPIPSGRIIELELNVNPDGKPTKILINVNFNPRSFPTSVLEYIVSANFDQKIADRYLKAQAGEIRFFRDFIMQLDVLHKREKALKNDKDGVLADIFRHQNSSSIRQIFKMVFQKNKSYNLANGVLIVDENDFNTFAKKYNLNMKRPGDRAKFFMSTFSLFIVLVDTRYSRVTIYTHGISQGSEYSYSELKANAQSDKVDMTTMMEFMAKNQLPKF